MAIAMHPSSAGGVVRATPRVTSIARLVAALALVTASTACGGGRELGEACDTTSECASSLQCLQQVCVPRCTAHVDCGEGAVCESGECRTVVSAIGDVCATELDCGPGQTCRLPATFGADATCQAEHLGALEGESCATDGGCRSGACALGHCVGLCRRNPDCRRGWLCAKIPRRPLDFNGCLPGNTALEFEVPVATAPGDPPEADVEVEVPVASTADSMLLLFEARASGQWVGASLLKDPNNRVLYRRPIDLPAYYGNQVRHVPLAGLSTLQVPTSTSAPLEAGTYTVGVTRFRLDQDPGSSGGSNRENGPLPRLRVIEKLGSGARLDLHFYFRDLTDHPCEATIGADLSATTAPSLAGFQQQFLPEIERVFETANIHLGDVTYTDLDGVRPEAQRHEFDVLDAAAAPALFAEATATTGVSIFFVRSIEPEGLQLVTGGTPGAPVPGTGASGIALALDSLCYRDWTQLARQAAHGVARHMGLFRNIEPDGLPGHVDPIGDSPDTMDNLMYWSEFGGTELSLGQRDILRASPVLR